MPKKSPDQEAQVFGIYPGVRGFPAFGGVVTEEHPGQIPGNKLTRALNVRVIDGIAIRPGETDATNNNPFQSSGACVRTLFQFSCDPLRMWIATFGCPGNFGGSLTGGALVSYDPEQSPALQGFAVYKSNANRDAVLGVYGGELYVGDGSNLRRIIQSPPMYGVDAQAVEPTPPDVLLASFPGFSVTAIGEFAGKMFVGLANNSVVTSSKIVSWDGGAFTDELTGIRPPTAFCLFRDLLAVGCTSADNRIRFRDSSGTWTTLSPGAGTVACFGPNGIISWRDSLWLADGAQTVWKCDGATITAARVVATAAGIPGMASVAVFSDQLYYAYSTATTSFLGKYDASGSSIQFEDTHKDFGGQFSNLKSVYAIVAYRNLLYALFYGADPILTLISSPDYDTGGTWQGTNPATYSVATRPFILLVY